MKTPTVRVMVACNNRHGMIGKRFEAIQFHTALDIIADVECPPTCITEHWASGRIATVRLGRFLFPVSAYGHNVGNLIWNEYVIPHCPAFHRFIAALERRGAKCEGITVPAKMEDPSIDDWASLVRMERRAAR